MPRIFKIVERTWRNGWERRQRRNSICTCPIVESHQLQPLPCKQSFQHKLCHGETFLLYFRLSFEFRNSLHDGDRHFIRVCHASQRDMVAEVHLAGFHKGALWLDSYARQRIRHVSAQFHWLAPMQYMNNSALGDQFRCEIERGSMWIGVLFCRKWGGNIFCFGVYVCIFHGTLSFYSSKWTFSFVHTSWFSSWITKADRDYEPEKPTVKEIVILNKFPWPNV